MPGLEIVSNNVPANTSNLDVINGRRASQVDMTVRAAMVTLWAVSSAVGLTHSLFIGGRNPLEVSVVPVSATPDAIILDQNGIISGMEAIRGEVIRLFLNETAGVSTNDYRARINVREF